MANIGDIAKLINAQNLKLKKGSDEYITIFNLEHPKDPVITRVNSRAGAIDFFSNPIIEVLCDALVTEAVYQNLNTANTLNSRGVYPVEAYTILGENINGVSGDDLSVTFNASMVGLNMKGGENGGVAVRMRIRVVNSTYAVGS